MSAVTLYAEYLPSAEPDETGHVLLKLGAVAIAVIALTAGENTELVGNEPGSEPHDHQLSLVGARWLSSRLAMRW